MTIIPRRAGAPVRGRSLRAVVAVATVFGIGMLAGAGQPALAIENGDPVAQPNPFPYVAHVLVPYASSGYESCTGTLIAPTWVLTAAHCLTTPRYSETSGPIRVSLDRTSGDDGNAVERTTTTGAIGDGFDLALLHVDPVEGIKPLPVATPYDKASHSKGTIATVVGWGGNDGATTDHPGRLLVGQQKVDDQVYSQAQKAAYVGDLEDGIDSAGYNYLMKTLPVSVTRPVPGCVPLAVPTDGPPSAAIPPRSCESTTRFVIAPGDSGGPLIGERPTATGTEAVQIGVASQGTSSDDGAYTKTTSTFPWILSVIRNP